MRRVFAVLLAIACLSAGGSARQPQSKPGIRLVLLVAVDQFRYDYLTRFRGDYTDGLNRLLTEGAVFTDAHLEHYPTVTAVGHATMLTGATPSVSGIIGNDWFDRASGATVTSVSDGTVSVVGVPATDTGSASPRRLLVSTVPDEIKLASRAARGTPAAPRAIGISLKDRSAILAVGRGADAAYWWDTRSGRFVTSTYYLPEPPQWLQAFNDRRLVDAYAGKVWTLLTDPSVTVRRFPAERSQALNDAVYASPFGNDVLLALAEDVLQHEQLGQRGATDVLSVSFSSNDSVGHTHGPDSPNVRDISAKTDRVIGRLLNRVDKLIGLQHTVVAFTTDHGVAPVPEAVQQHSLPGGRLTSRELFGPIEQALAARFGEGRWVLGTAGSSPYLNYELIARQRLDPADVRRVAAEAARAVPHVARVYTRDQLVSGEVADDRIGKRVLRGFNAQRSGDLEIVFEPYWMRQATGTTHGTPYSYDAQIPLILMGRPFAPGEYTQHAALNDLAPTLSTVVRVAMPSGSSGRVLTEALRPTPTHLSTADGR